MFLRHQRLEAVPSGFISRDRLNQSFLHVNSSVKRVSSILSSLLIFLLLFSFSIIPIQFCKAVGTPSFWDSRVYPLGLVDEGSAEAGIKGFTNEYGFFSTSQWTQFAFDLKNGGLVCQANLIQIPGTLLPLTFSLAYSSKNANVDIGLGKGWMTNLHSCVSEDVQTHDLTYITPTGAKMVFEYDSQTSSYINPKSFTGFAVENQDGTYTIQTLDGQIATFSSNGKLASLSSLTGGLLEVGYDGSGRPETLTDFKSSREITLTWDVNGILTGAEDMLGNTWSFSYTSSNLTEIQQPSDDVPDPDIHTTFGYDANHMLTSQVDFEGFEYEITYHSSGYQANKVATFVEPTENAATSEFTYQEDQEGYDKKTTLTDGENRNTYYYFSDTTEHLMKTSMVNNTTVLKTEYEYNALGLVSTISDSYDKDTTLTYDDVGHIETITYPLASGGTPFVQQFTYSPQDNVLGKLVEAEEKVTSSVWATTALAYTDNKAPFSPSQITDPLGNDTFISYNIDKQPVSIVTETTGGMKTATMEYSVINGNLTDTTDFASNDTALSYNANGLVTGMIQYEGDEQTADIVSNLTIDYNEVGISFQVSNSTTGESSSITSDDNGATTGSESVTGCLESLVFSYSSYLMAKGISSAAPVAGSGGIGVIGILDPITLPYDPNPYEDVNPMGHSTIFDYYEDGMLYTSTNYLSQTTTFSQDAFGRPATETNAFGRVTENTYNLNSWLTEKEIEGIGTYTFTLNDRGEITSVSDPIRGTLNYTYNVRGDQLTGPDATYTNDILGRTTQASYTGGLSDSFEYTPEGWLSSISNQDFTYDSIGNLTGWSDGAGNAQSLTYNSSIGSSVLGLPSAITGTADLSSYSMTYTARNWLQTFTDTNKGKTFSYTWDSDKTLTAMQYPNQTLLTQTWDQKMLDTVTVTKGEDTYLDIDSSFNNLDQITSYEYSVYAGQGQTFSESYSMEYDNLNRISELTSDSNDKVLTYAYDQTVGKLASITDSLLNDSYDFSYDSKERMDYITYPGVQGTVSFSYDDLNGKGRLEQVTYPGSKTMTFLWDSRDRITSIVLNDTIKEIEYILEYNDAGKIKKIRYYEDDILIRTWNASYGLYGLEKIVAKNPLDQPILTQDFTTDPNGTILSMTYTPTQGFGGLFSGEAYHYYDPCTDTMVLADSNGDPKASYAISRSSGHVEDSWNPSGIVNIVAIGGGKGPSFTLPGFGEKEIILPWRPQSDYKIALIDAEFAIDIGISGATASTSMSDCGETQPCGGGLSRKQQYDLCMARCFTWGVEGIGDLDSSQPLDDYAKNNYKRWQQADKAFRHIAWEIIENYGPVALAATALVITLIATHGAIAAIIAALDKIGLEVGAFILTLMELIDDGNNEIKEAYKDYVNKMSFVTMIGGEAISVSCENGMYDSISAWFRASGQEGQCLGKCYDLVYNNEPGPGY